MKCEYCRKQLGSIYIANTGAYCEDCISLALENERALADMKNTAEDFMFAINHPPVPVDQPKENYELHSPLYRALLWVAVAWLVAWGCIFYFIFSASTAHASILDLQLELEQVAEKYQEVRCKLAEAKILEGIKIKPSTELVCNIVPLLVTTYQPLEAQTDNSPCIGAGGENLCELHKRGTRLLALSQDIVAWTGGFIPYGSVVRLKSNDKRCHGLFYVADTMNRRFTKRGDRFTLKENYSCNAILYK